MTDCTAKKLNGSCCTRKEAKEGLCVQHYRMKHGKSAKSRVMSKSRKFSVSKVLSVYKDCPSGTMKRRSYVRKSYVRANGTKVSGVKVKSSCIPDRGIKTRLWEIEHKSMGIGRLKKGELTGLGYHIDLPVDERHNILNKAVEKYGSLSVLRKLNAIAVYDKRTHPEDAKKYIADRDYVRVIHGEFKRKNKSMSKTPKLRKMSKSRPRSYSKSRKSVKK